MNIPGRMIIVVSNLATACFTNNDMFLLTFSKFTISYEQYKITLEYILENIIGFILFNVIVRRITIQLINEFHNTYIKCKYYDNTPVIVIITFQTFHLHWPLVRYSALL